MELNITLVSVIIVAIAIWVLLETKRFKHKMVAIIAVFVILFTYFSFTAALSGRSLDLSTINGIGQAGSIYLSWLSSVFSNLKVLTTNAIRMNWGVVGNHTINSSIVNSTIKNITG